jgi:hypothetical protein
LQQTDRLIPETQKPYEPHFHEHRLSISVQSGSVMMASGHELRASIVKPLSTGVHLERYKDAKTKTESCNPQQAFISVEKVTQMILFFLAQHKSVRKLCTDAKWRKRAKPQDRLRGICQA